MSLSNDFEGSVPLPDRELSVDYKCIFAL